MIEQFLRKICECGSFKSLKSLRVSVIPHAFIKSLRHRSKRISTQTKGKKIDSQVLISCLKCLLMDSRMLYLLFDTKIAVCFASGTFQWRFHKNSDIKSSIKLKISEVYAHTHRKKETKKKKKCELRFGASDECAQRKSTPPDHCYRTEKVSFLRFSTGNDQNKRKSKTANTIESRWKTKIATIADSNIGNI